MAGDVPLGLDCPSGSPAWLDSISARQMLDDSDDLFQLASVFPVVGDDVCAFESDDEALFGSMAEAPPLHVATNPARLGAWSDRELVLAEAAAAGLHRGGLTRHAFSTGDLQALQPADDAPVIYGPPPPQAPRILSRGNSRAPRLQSVPEGSAAQSATLQSPGIRPLPESSLASGSALSGLPSAMRTSVSTAGQQPEYEAFLQQQAPLLGVGTTGVGTIEPVLRRSPEEGIATACTDHEAWSAKGGRKSAVTSEAVAANTVQPQTAPPSRGLLSLGRSQSAVDLHRLSSNKFGCFTDDCSFDQVTVELMTPEGHVYHVGKLSRSERAQKILKYRQKRHERNFTKRIKYQCRKTLADSRPRIRGRFARNDDAGAVLPHETKKALAAKQYRSSPSAGNHTVKGVAAFQHAGVINMTDGSVTTSFEPSHEECISLGNPLEPASQENCGPSSIERFDSW